MTSLPKIGTKTLVTMTLITSIVKAQIEDEEFTIGSIVGLTIAGMTMVILLVVVIVFALFMYTKNMCYCLKQRRFEPELPPVMFTSFNPGPYTDTLSPFGAVTLVTRIRPEREEQPDEQTEARTQNF